MLAQEKVKPFLQHDEKVVRDFVAQYFHDSYSKDQDLMPLVLEMTAKVPSEEPYGLILAYASEFTQSEVTLQEVVRRMSKSNDVINRYQRIFANSDVDLLDQFSAYVDRLQPRFKKAVRQRLKLAGMSTKMLWDELYQIAHTGRNKHIGEFDYPYGQRIVQELGRRDDLQAHEILDPLNELFLNLPGPGVEKYDHRYGYNVPYDYSHIYLTILAGEKRLTEAIPALVNFLKCDGDLSAERSVEALIKIGTPEVVHAIQKEFAQESWSFRLFAKDIFGHVKLPESEQALFDLLPHEEDIEIRTGLASSMCYLLSMEGIPLVEQVIADGYDRMMLDLEEDLYVNHICHEMEIPQSLIEWKRGQDRREEREPNPLLQALRGDHPSLPPDNQPVRKQKIGRNEPCPCGSGKKYKKCCGA